MTDDFTPAGGPEGHVDDALIAAGDELRAHLDARPLWPFAPSPRRAPVVAAIALVLVAAGGFVLLRGDDSPSVVMSTLPSTPPDRTVADTIVTGPTADDPTADSTSPEPTSADATGTGTTPTIAPPIVEPLPGDSVVVQPPSTEPLSTATTAPVTTPPTTTAPTTTAPTTTAPTTTAPVTTVPGPARVGAADIDWSRLVTSTEALPQHRLDRPGLGSSVVDPVFATTITRITDAGVGESIVPLASAGGAWNSDDSLILLYRQGSGYELYDGRTGAFRNAIAISPADIEEVYWSATEPAVLHFVDGIDLVAFDVTTASQTVLHTFAGCARVESGQPVPPSNDGSLWGLVCTAADGAEFHVAYRLGETADHRRAAPGGAVAPIPLGSGTGLLLPRSGGGLDLYDPTLTTVNASFPDIEDHNIITVLDADGAELIVSTSFDGGNAGIGSAIAHPVAGGPPRALVGDQTGHGSPPSGTHFAAGSGTAPHRFAITNRATRADGDAGVGVGEIMLVDTAGDGGQPVVARIGHHRTDPSDYFAFPFIGLNRAGDRVLFSSDWSGSGRVDTYLITLP